MLTNRSYAEIEEIDFIHNFYERLVIQELFQQSRRIQEGDRNFLADVACIALNCLPSRYIRHDVDATFFMSPQELIDIEQQVTRAVTDALSYVEARERGEDSHLPMAAVTLATARCQRPANPALDAEDTEASLPTRENTQDIP